MVGAALGVFSILADGVIGGRLFNIHGNLASPWGLAAFLVGLRTTSLRRGALAGGLTLVVGVATYYLGVVLRGGYVLGAANVVWIVVAAVAGPIMGLSGAAISSQPEAAISRGGGGPRLQATRVVFAAVDSKVPAVRSTCALICPLLQRVLV